jgi:hypothetical protein
VDDSENTHSVEYGDLLFTLQEHGRWRIRTNAELEQCCTTTIIVTTIRTKRLEWAVHVEQMSNQRMVKKVYGGSMAGRRCRDRWIDDMEEDLRSVGVKRWRKRALDKREWAAVVKEAKAKL